MCRNYVVSKMSSGKQVASLKRASWVGLARLTPGAIHLRSEDSIS
jgi:hypothetical protein